VDSRPNYTEILWVQDCRILRVGRKINVYSSDLSLHSDTRNLLECWSVNTDVGNKYIVCRNAQMSELQYTVSFKHFKSRNSTNEKLN
jgi:hypothetical protein